MIIIKKDKIVFDPESRKREKETIEEKDLPRFLSEEVEIGKDVTFGRIFDLIVLHKDLFNVIFDSGCLHGHKIEMYLDSYNADVEKEGQITYLESCWGTDYWDFGEKDREVSIYPSFHGIAENYTDKNMGGEPFDCPFGIVSDISGYKNLPFKINNGVSFMKRKDDKYKVVLNGKHKMNLFNVISGILFEISWYGTPENSKEFFEDMAKTVERIESGEEDLYEMKKNKKGKIKFKKIKKKK